MNKFIETFDPVLVRGNCDRQERAQAIKRNGGTHMLIEGNGLNVIQLLPEEVERLLIAEYGDKLAAINVARMEKRKQQRTKSADYYQRKNRNNNFLIEGQK